jgi:hypothetical protein
LAPAKQQLTIPLDADVLIWLKANGRGYQTRINCILRAAMESKPRPRSITSAPKKSHAVAPVFLYRPLALLFNTIIEKIRLE